MGDWPHIRGGFIPNDLIDRITCVSCRTDSPHAPGVKANDHTDRVGWLAVVAALLGVTAHGLFRWHTKRRRKRG